MSIYPLEIHVRAKAGTYTCSKLGQRASSTHSPEVALGKLMERLFPPNSHRATLMHHGVGEYVFFITPVFES